jgi:hypothetical protein
MKSLDEIELNMLLQIEDLVKHICPVERSSTLLLPSYNLKDEKYYVYLLFNDNTLNYLCETDENGEFNITLNKDSFYGVGTMPCIAIFTAHIPHKADKECKFIDFRNDGYKVAPHKGLIETAQAKDKKQHLLDVWFD